MLFMADYFLFCLGLFRLVLFFFFFNDTATTEIYTLSLHDALPISCSPGPAYARSRACSARCRTRDRKSTRLNSSHVANSYAVFCLKKKKKTIKRRAGKDGNEQDRRRRNNEDIM